MDDRGDWGQLGSILYYMHHTCLGDIRFPFVYFHFSFTTTFPVRKMHNDTKGEKWLLEMRVSRKTFKDKLCWFSRIFPVLKMHALALATVVVFFLRKLPSM